MTRRRLPALPRAALLAALPVLLVQGSRVRRTTTRLADAEGVEGAVGAGEDPLRLVVLGDSVAAGVGLAHHDESLVGHLARALAERDRRPVAWLVLAQTGATAAGALALVDDAVLGEADVVVVSTGVNDTKDLHSDRRWRADLGRLLDAVLAAAPEADVLLLGIPPMEVFPALPSPLAELLGARSRRLDRIGAEVAAARPRVRRLQLDLPDDTDAFASDGFHPSSAVHAHLADVALRVL
jgi:lysophospholipase L1-like esterase